MSTPGYPGHGQNPPYGTPASPGAPGAGVPSVPQGVPPTPQGTPYGAPPPLPTQRDHRPAPQQTPYAPHGPRGPEPAMRRAAPYTQPPVDPFALAAAAPLGTPEDPHTPLPRPGRTSAAPPSVGAGPAAPVAAPPAGPSAPPAMPAPSASPFSAPSSPPASPSAEPIDFVPGITEDSAPRRAAAQGPAVPPQPPAPSAAPAAEEPARAEPVTPPAPPAALPPEPAPAAAEAPPALRLAILVWDDGERHDVDGRLLIGRNPAEEEGVAAIAVRDETLSLSKTHFELEASDDGVWLIDRHSTNGVVLVRGAERRQAGPGERTRLAAGDVLEMGDRRATIEERS